MSDLLFDIKDWVEEHRLEVLLALVVLAAGVYFVGPKIVGKNDKSEAVSFTGISGGPRQAPHTVEIAEGKAAYKLTWQGTWGASRASASGALLMTTCKPRCESKQVPVLVRAEQQIECDGSKQYARLIVDPKGKAKPITVSNGDPSCRS